MTCEGLLFLVFETFTFAAPPTPDAIFTSFSYMQILRADPESHPNEAETSGRALACPARIPTA
jgi:hypothetical protein